MTEIVAIRPQPGCSATVMAGAALGLAITAHPLFAIAAVAWTVPDASRHDAVLLGSANAVRHGGAGLAALTELPAICVGETTARAAREAGFTVALVGRGGLQQVVPQAQAMGFPRLLRLAGEAHVPLELPAGLTAATRVVYRVEARPVAASLAATLRQGAVVLLHSGEAAAHFADEVDRLGLARRAIALACLAPRIAGPAGTGWAALEIAAATDDAALLAIAGQMCQAFASRPH